MREIIPNQPKKNVRLWQEIEARAEEMVRTARELADQMRAMIEQEEHKRLDEKNKKDRQLRNIQEVAERSGSWAEVELFIRYQAARNQIPKGWAQQAVERLNNLRETARDITQRALGSQPDEVVRKVHLELIRLVLGYTVRWHVWDAKGESQPQGGR